MNWSNRIPDGAPPLGGLEDAFRRIWSESERYPWKQRFDFIVSPDVYAHLQAEELSTYAERCTAHELVGYRRRKAELARKRNPPKADWDKLLAEAKW